MLIFTSLSLSHIPLMHHWFNLPHVQAFYSLRDWKESDVLEKLKPQIEKEKPVFGYIIFFNNKPIGYIQYYLLSDYPWKNLSIDPEITEKSAGIDLFLGDPEYIGIGKGQEILEQFLKKFVWPNYTHCFVDPDIKNKASIRMFEKSGFHFYKELPSKDALNRNITLYLMERLK